MVMLRRLELRRPRVRGALLEPLCIQHHLVQRLGVEPSRPFRTPGLQSGRGPSPANAAFGASDKVLHLSLDLFRVTLICLSYRGNVGGECRNRTDLAICLQSKSGFLGHSPFLVPNQWNRTLSAGFVGAGYLQGVGQIVAPPRGLEPRANRIDSAASPLV